jgi:hypothetical protein
MKDGRITILGDAADAGVAVVDTVAREEAGAEGFAKIVVYGSEVLEKEVKESGTSGRVYLPRGWRGHRVKIVRID